jgi:hypothetical protein
MTTIEAVVYSFKNKNLKKVVDAILNNTDNPVRITIYDQHPLLREDLFADDRISYNHIFWDHIHSPGSYKVKVLDKTSADYVLLISDDYVVSPGWDTLCIKQLETNHNSLVSGIGKPLIRTKDLFSIKAEYENSTCFENTSYVTKDFIFGRSKVILSIPYPSEVKYFGENELLSYRFFKNKTQVFSAPSGVAHYLNEKTLESKYKTFSLEHRYNIIFKEISNDFWISIGFDKTPIVPLPYTNDDVMYNPSNTHFDDLDSRKFISNVKAIY